MLPVHCILERNEVEAVVAPLKRSKSKNAKLNLVIFRLSCCYGLRAKEISHLRLRDVQVDSSHPIIKVRTETTKGREGKRKGRTIPLNWSPAALADLVAWKAQRLADDPDALVVCSMSRASYGTQLNRHQLHRKWHTAMKPLGEGRAEQVSIHKGRHTFISHALAAGYSLAEVAAAAGHRDASVTARTYMHVVQSLNGEQRPDVFRV